MKRFFYLLVFWGACLPALAVGNISNILTQEMLDTEGRMFYVRANYTLEGATLTIPAGKVLVFSGGSLDNGEIIGTGTSFQMNQQKPAFGLNLVISGTWAVPEVHDGWFMFDSSEGFVSNQIIKNILALSNDETPCHILFEENRTYYFELPYKGRGDLGRLVGTIVVNGQEKRDYAKLLRDEFDYLRIFTIPSNTHLTVNNRLKMLPTSIGAYYVFWEYGKHNITIDGKGTIAGDNDWHLYDQPFTGKTFFGEWGHVFRCIRCSDFVFRDITISNAFGDCIIYSGSYIPDEKEQRWSSGLLMENVKIIGARRNGLAVGAKDVVIRNCHFENCGTDEVKGTKPRAGVDFEPDGLNYYPEIGNENVLMENCTFKGNYYDIASYNNNKSRYGKVATTVRNCTFTSTIRLTESRWLRFENCYFPAVSNTNLSRHLEFVNCEFGEIKQEMINAPKNYYYSFTKCKFNTIKE
jgi:hypothetical protein